MPYEFLEEVAVADIAFKAWGNGLNEAFLAAADALLNVMVEDLDSVTAREVRPVELENTSLEMLLFDFLQETIYFKDSEQLLLRSHEVEIEREDRGYRLHCRLSGEKIDPEKHRLRVDVKAVTLHQFCLEETARGWEAFVILDI